MFARNQTSPDIDPTQKSGPDKVGWPCQTLPTFDPTNVGWKSGEMSGPFDRGFTDKTNGLGSSGGGNVTLQEDLKSVFDVARFKGQEHL